MKKRLVSLLVFVCMLFGISVVAYADEELSRVEEIYSPDSEYDNYIGKTSSSQLFDISLFSYSTGYPNTYVNTGNQALDIAGIAKTQVGYTETGVNGTKYNAWFYGSDKSAAWCAIFISWCANQAGVSTSVISRNAVASGYSTSNMSKNPYNTPAYSFSNHTPQIGDIVFIDNTGNNVSNHVGLVVDVDGSYIYTVEGNYSDKVSSVKYARSNGQRNGSSTTKIVFYAVPNYVQPNHTIDETYGHNFSATCTSKQYTLTENHATEGNRWIDAGDVCTIHNVYTDGCCYVTYPSGDSTREAWGKIEWFSFEVNKTVDRSSTYKYKFDTIPSTPTYIDAYSFNGHVYTLYASNYTWTQARDYCKNQGGYLATVTSSQEAFIVDKLSSLYAGELECVWLGAESTSGSWKWVNGDAFSYSKWGSSQPDCGAGVEFYLGYRYSKSDGCVKWNDFENSFSGRAGFVMETRNTVSNTSLEVAPKVCIKADTRINDFLESEYDVNPSIYDDKRIESINIDLNEADGDISYAAHFSQTGWTGFVNGGTTLGKSDGTTSIEAIKIKLTGNIAGYYNVYYRTNVFNKGWTGWAKNGEISGSIGGSLPIKALEIILVPIIRYHTHIQGNGWTVASYDGDGSGTTGQEKRAEAMYFKLHDCNYGGVAYRTHSAEIGWTAWRENGDWSGTTGACLQAEAYQLKLTGEAENLYDVLYKAHVQDRNWMSWHKNGQTSGTVGEGKRLEAIAAKTVPKGYVEGQATYSELEPKKYNLTFDANGGTCDSVTISSTWQGLYYNNISKFPTPTREGYSFEGWYTAREGGEKITNSSIYEQESDSTLYAQWEYITPHTESTVTKANNTYTVSTEPINITFGKIIVGGYKNNILINFVMRDYSKENEIFELNGDIDTIKVMLWDGLNSIKPSATAEIIPQSEFIVK